MMQWGQTDQWPSYPPRIHIGLTTIIKLMPDKMGLRLPPLDLKKKKGKVFPHSPPMPNPGLKESMAPMSNSL